jgi:hypothetical protein
MKQFFLFLFSIVSNLTYGTGIDLRIASVASLDLVHPLAQQVAQKYEIDFNLVDSAIATSSQDSTFYSLILRYEDAEKMSFTFSDFGEPSAIRMCIRPLTTDSVYTFYPSKYGFVSTNLFAGSAFELTLCLPNRYAKPSVRLLSFGVSHKGDSSHSDGNRLKAKSSGCNVDIACPEGAEWRQIAGSVCKLYINNSTHCTGTLVNNTAEDQRLYVLTANHCVSDTQTAKKIVFTFDYENLSCNGTPIASYSVTGSTLRATSPDKSIDFALLELREDIPYDAKLYFAGWDATSDAPLDQAVTIHHPQGDVKKISQSKNAPITAWFDNTGMTYTLVKDSHWKVDKWEYGVTQGGSSGSALFNKQQRIIGTLVGGDANCSYPYNDFFQKMSYSWDYFSDSSQQLKYWLDPLRTGAKQLHGMGRKDYCGGSADDLFVLFTSSSSGYVFGTREDDASEFGRYFYRSGHYLSAVGVYVAHNTLAGSDTVYLRIYETSENGNTLLSQFPVRANELRPYSKNIISLPRSVEMPSKMLISVYMPHNEVGTFSLYSNYKDGYDPLTAIKQYDTWLSANDLAIKCELPMCIYSAEAPFDDLTPYASVKSDVATGGAKDYFYPYDSIIVYPNPTKDGIFSLVLQGVMDEIVDVNVVAADGSTVHAMARNIHLTGNVLQCDFSGLPSGIYSIQSIAGSHVLYRNICIQKNDE